MKKQHEQVYTQPLVAASFLTWSVYVCREDGSGAAIDCLLEESREK